jgi:para-nitrobenzyl esterase
VQGVEVDGGRAFTAIPFAAPPVGPLRFRAPQPVPRWRGAFSATGAIPSCIQFGGNGTALQSEDCLYLSVWTPSVATPTLPVPVMVWIFGGGLVQGSPQDFDGADLARNGVVVVTLNYRLGVLGMMTDRSLDDGAELSGNYALRDQQAALRWVKSNIGAFGGDASRVTLFGQSSGASSVLMHLVSPASKGLFSKAIVESSGGGYLYERQVVQDGVARKVIRAVGCAGRADVAGCLRTVPAAAFVSAKVNMSSSGEHAAEALGLVTDAALLPIDTWRAFNSGQFNQVPVLIGTSENEGAAWVAGAGRALGRPLEEADLPAIARDTFFGADADFMLAAYPLSRYASADERLMHAVTDYRQACPTQAVRMALSQFVPVYGYELTEADPAQTPPDARTTRLVNTPRHGTELAYVFGRDRGQALSGRAAVLSARVQQYWSNFARIGNPDPAGLDWPRFSTRDPAVLKLQEPPASARDFTQRHHCSELWERGVVKH